MIDARAEWTSNESQGPALPLSDLLPPSSRQDLISTLPGIAPSTKAHYAPSPYAHPCASTEMEQHPEYAGLSSPGSQITATEAQEDQRTEWCVDYGRVLATMDTFELWDAIDRGNVVPSMRVWREGMECWTPVGQVAELALAFQTPPSSSSTRTPEPVTLHASPAAGSPAKESPCPATLRPSTAGEARAPAHTLVSGPHRSAWERICHHLFVTVSQSRARAQVWVAAGSAIAATAITAAVISAEPPAAPSLPEAQAALAAPPAAATAPPAESHPAEPIEAERRESPAPSVNVASAEPPAPPEPKARSVAAIAAAPAAAQARLPASDRGRNAAPPRARHEEHGQRRLRRTGKYAYGL